MGRDSAEVTAAVAEHSVGFGGLSLGINRRCSFATSIPHADCERSMSGHGGKAFKHHELCIDQDVTCDEK